MEGEVEKSRWEIPGLFAVPGKCMGGYYRGKLRLSKDRSHALYTVSDGTNRFAKKFPVLTYYRDPEVAYKVAREFACEFSVRNGIEYNAYRRIGPGIIEMKVGKTTTIFDEEHLKNVRTMKWDVMKSGNVYHVRTTDSRPARSLHRLILDAARGQYVQHLDGNGLNNLNSNLAVKIESSNRVHLPEPKRRPIPREDVDSDEEEEEEEDLELMEAAYGTAFEDE